MILAALMSVFFLFDASPSPDLAGYEGRFWIRQNNLGVMSEMIPVPSFFWLAQDPNEDSRVVSWQPEKGQCVMEEIRAVDLRGVGSEWVGE